MNHSIKESKFCFCFLLASNVSHPISLYKFSIDTNFVVPVAILAASVCICHKLE